MCRIFGVCVMLYVFSIVRVINYSIVIGLNSLLMCCVLKCCMINSVMMIVSVIGSIVCLKCGVMIEMFFMVDSIEIVGVMMVLL